MTEGLVVGVFLVAALLSWRTAAAAWQHRRSTGAARALAVSLFATGAWSTGDALLHVTRGPLDGALLLAGIFAAVHLAVGGLHCLCRSVARPAWRLPPGEAALLVVAPVLMVAATLTDPWHHLVLGTGGVVEGGVAEGGVAPVVRFGPLLWVHTAYCYALLGLGLRHVVRARREAAGLHRRQLDGLLLGIAIPFVGNVLVLFFREQLGGDDYTPLFFVLAGLVVVRHGFLTIVPVGRERVLDTIGEAVFVIDPVGRLVDVNAAGRRLLRLLRPELPAEVLGREASSVLGAQVLAPLPGREGTRVLEAAAGVHLDARLTVLADHRGDTLARVVVVRDVSDMVAVHERLRQQLGVIEQLQTRLHEESIRDPLTGLHNRRHLMRALDAALLTARDTDEPVAILILDVDHFKAVNDTCGHPAGDEVLRRIAHTLLRGARTGDVVARYGGEEFLVLLGATDREAASRRAEELRARCAALRIPRPGLYPTVDGPAAEAGVLRVTVSVGVAAHPGDGHDARTLIAAADAALYAAKHGGRNRVVTAPAAAHLAANGSARAAGVPAARAEVRTSRAGARGGGGSTPPSGPAARR